MRTKKSVIVTYNVVSEAIDDEFVVKMRSSDDRHAHAVAETSAKMHKMFREPFYLVTFVSVVDVS